MLVLSRKAREEVVCRVGGIEFSVIVVDVRGDKVRLGFNGPQSVTFIRKEILEKDKNEDSRSIRGHRTDAASVTASQQWLLRWKRQNQRHRVPLKPNSFCGLTTDLTRFPEWKKNRRNTTEQTSHLA